MVDTIKSLVKPTNILLTVKENNITTMSVQWNACTSEITKITKSENATINDVVGA